MLAHSLRRHRWMQLLCLSVLVCLPFVSIQYGFSSPKQKPNANNRPRDNTQALSVEREKSGQAFRSRVTDMYFFKLSRPEGMLLRKISAASEKRDWRSVQTLLRNYTGKGEPIYSAAINAAFRCGKYPDGALIFDGFRQRFNITHMPLFTAALKIFGKCGQTERVRKVWKDALKLGDLDKDLALARISAAADEGDVITSAEVMDQMVASNVPVHMGHVVSAIRSCGNSGQPRHKAARYFFDLLPDFDIQKNTIAFSSLMRAYTTAPLGDILAAYEEMKALNIEPNKVFAELYVVAVFQGLRLSGEPDIIADTLRNMAVERLRAAQDALKDFEEARIKQTLLTRRIRKALKVLSF